MSLGLVFLHVSEVCFLSVAVSSRGPVLCVCEWWTDWPLSPVTGVDERNSHAWTPGGPAIPEDQTSRVSLLMHFTYTTLHHSTPTLTLHLHYTTPTLYLHYTYT